MLLFLNELVDKLWTQVDEPYPDAVAVSQFLGPSEL